MISTSDLLWLRVAQMPKSPDLAIVVLTNRLTDRNWGKYSKESNCLKSNLFKLQHEKIVVQEGSAAYGYIKLFE